MATPGILSIWRASAIGTSPPKRAKEKMRSSRASSCTLAKVAFMPMVSPNRVKASITDNKVRTARVGLRMIAAQTRGRYFMPGLMARSISWPLSIASWRLAWSAALGSWVTITMVLPCWRLSCCSSARMSSAEARSRSPVGSSHNRIGGSATMARAMPTRCCWPPDISPGLWLARSDRPTISSAAATRRWRSLLERCVSSSGSSTLPAADSIGIRL